MNPDGLLRVLGTIFVARKHLQYNSLHKEPLVLHYIKNHKQINILTSLQSMVPNQSHYSSLCFAVGYKWIPTCDIVELLIGSRSRVDNSSSCSKQDPLSQ